MRLIFAFVDIRCGRLPGFARRISPPDEQIGTCHSPMITIQISLIANQKRGEFLSV